MLTSTHTYVAGVEVSIEQSSYTFLEGDDRSEVCVIANGEPTQDISVMLAVSCEFRHYKVHSLCNLR